ncbi:MAG TPA: cytochrome c, partial [Blastocatellia bacterium]|nr:cytochrome c [Blastocatellia bacterium]
IALLLTAALATAGLTQTHKTESKGDQFATLPDLMRDGIHEQFTFLSFAIYHDEPLTANKLDRISKSALTLSKLARRIPELGSSYAAGAERSSMLEARARALAQNAEELAHAARVRKQKSVQPLFSKVESACSDCHTKFRAELVLQDAQ